MLNLKKYKTIIGYSGHEKGLQISLAAVAIGAKIIERHITLDRTMGAQTKQLPRTQRII